jgi:hypothetical protein
MVLVLIVIRRVKKENNLEDFAVVVKNPVARRLSADPNRGHPSS